MNYDLQIAGFYMVSLSVYINCHQIIIHKLSTLEFTSNMIYIVSEKAIAVTSNVESKIAGLQSMAMAHPR